ncbi:MAG: hypothetical protein LC637_09965 [Xanthomonadaceae bacterium]|nr:hypothetical protein [Xanthomonadaceae bacterium]
MDLYGLYADAARSAAMFHFGMALHHVEDMSSPAHVHNDPHLTFLAPERDDYEGYYLPYQRLPESLPGVTGLSFAGATAVTPVDDPVRDIWGVDNPQSLVRLTHARTTYQATLAFPTGNALHFQGDLLVIVPTPAPGLPQGELAEMFPCPGGDTDDACLHWSEDALGAMAHWEINGVGGYHHQFTLGHDNAWWPLSEELAASSTGGASTPGLGVPDGANGFYYIEQLALNNDKSDPLGTPVVPVGIRADFNQPWNAVGNPVVANSDQRPLLAFYTDHLLAPPVTYGAGFTQYWYDVANTPPYLKRVYVAQDGQGVTYHAEWQDVPGERRRYTHANVASCYAITLELNCPDTNIEVETVGARELTTLPGELRHLSELSDVTLTLEFNEAVAGIEGLAFGAQDAQGGCQEGQSACLDVLSLALTPTVSDDEKTWVFRLPGSELAGLNGKLVMTVRAIDKNNHRDGNGDTAGAQLDDSPATPARRMTVDAAGGLPEHYPWQTAETPCDPGAPEGESGCYAYDYAQGDRNHYLLFDTSAPSGEIVVDTTL